MFERNLWILLEIQIIQMFMLPHSHQTYRISMNGPGLVYYEVPWVISMCIPGEEPQLKFILYTTQMRKLRFREIKHTVQGHTASNGRAGI